MDTSTGSRKLSDVQRGVETALRNFVGRGNSEDDPTQPTAMDRIDRIGKMSALAIGEAADTTARDIKAAAQVAVDVAADLMREADQLATDLRTNGEQISQHLREFALLAKKVSTAMRDTRSEVLNAEHNEPPALQLAKEAVRQRAASDGIKEDAIGS